MVGALCGLEVFLTKTHPQVPSRCGFWGPPFSPVQTPLGYSSHGLGSRLQAGTSVPHAPSAAFPKHGSAGFPSGVRVAWMSLNLPWSESGPPLSGGPYTVRFPWHPGVLLLFCAEIPAHSRFSDGLSRYFKFWDCFRALWSVRAALRSAQPRPHCPAPAPFRKSDVQGTTLPLRDAA